MTWPSDEIAGAGSRGRLLASHAEREQVVEVLKAAFVQGRLDSDDFDLRVGLAFASRTYADLAALTADIPAGLLRAQPPVLARESVSKKKRKKKAVAALACATPAIPGLLVALPPIPDGSPFAVLVIALVCVWGTAVPTGWMLLFHAWLEERAGRQSAPGLPPGTGGEASRRLGPAVQFPQVERGPRQVAEAAAIHHSRPALGSWWPPNRGHSLGRRFAIGYPGH